MAYEKPKAEDFINLKNQIRNELQKRRIYSPDLSGYAKNYSQEPVKNGKIFAEHQNVIVEQIQKIKTNNNDIVTPKKTKISLGNLQSIITGITNQSIQATVSDCTDGSCAGMCVTTCGNTCSSSCTGGCKATCTGTCTGGCSGGCSGGCDGCSGTCGARCTEDCYDTCYTRCTKKCNSNCTGSCSNICSLTCGITTSGSTNA